MLEAADIHKMYSSGDKNIHVLRGIDIVVEKGKFIAILGPSGAGKSTLLHILGGLDAPTQGRVIFDRDQLYRLSDAALSRVRNEKIGFVFQFYHLLGEFNVLENVMMPALISRGAKMARGELKIRAQGLLTEVGLKERTAHFPSELSGGEQQRVAIARALINRPRLLLCDEPTGNLDSETGLGIIALLKKINSQDKTTLVLVTHNLELAKQADKAYYLKDGILVN
ncbi:MAG: ABC transporter ATP-binding protein [Candidatus Omnitrophica bacterium]|nr:ABC transporter ATP-binding protein [Candidatus Omnitrophota bacterium]